MIKILITGAGSYIGTSFTSWLLKCPGEYECTTLDMEDASWKDFSFEGYDVVFHVAGIVHVNENKKNKNLFHKVNCDLTYETAKKARMSGVKQFIFLSTMSVYGIYEGIINANTVPNPKSQYGISKLQAEKLLLTLQVENFCITILRPPIVYGGDCGGNYNKLVNLAKLTPIFPNIGNKRSMIYINNLCEFSRLLIMDCSEGIFFPQNKEYINISEIVRLVAKFNKHKIIFIKAFNKIINILAKHSTILNKMFKNLTYDDSMSGYFGWKYCIYNFDESIEESERGDNY